MARAMLPLRTQPGYAQPQAAGAKHTIAESAAICSQFTTRGRIRSRVHSVDRVNATLQLVVPVLAAVVTGGCGAYIGLHKRLAPGARACCVMMLSQTWWSLGYVGELLAPDLRGKVFWDDVQLPPPFFVALGLLFFSYEYTGRSTRALWHWLWAFALLPAATCAWVFTDPLHGLARASAHIASDPPFGALLYDFSGVELLAFIEVYAVSMYASYRLLSHSAMQSEPHRRQAILVSGGVLLDLFASLPGLLGYRWFGQRDSAPLWFAISGVCLTWALTRHQLFDLVPIARDAVIDNLPDPIFVLDSQDRLLDSNPAARRLFGDADSGGGLPPWLTAFEVPEITYPGSETIYEVKEAPLRTDAGELRGRALILRDVTEQRRARMTLLKAHGDLEQRVAERTSELQSANTSLRQQIEETRAARASAQASEAKFRAIFDGAYELIGMLTPDGHLIEPNRTALALAGVSHEDVRGKLFWETPWWTHSPDLQARLRSAIERAGRGEFARFEVTHRSPTGELRLVDFSLTPVFGEDGNVASLVAEGRDISDRKQAEEENARLQAQLYQAQKLDSIGRLAGGVAHDFNNLLTVIIGNVDLARVSESLSPRMREHLHDIQEASLSAAALTRQLLAFARRQIAEPRVIDLNGSVSNVQKLLARLLGEDIQLQLELDPDLWRVRVDPSHAEQMLINLAVNARDAMPSGGQLTLRTENRVGKPPEHLGPAIGNEYVVISISDRGVGISADVLPQIFEPFFTTKPQGMGTGLGLAMVYGAMQQALGVVDVQSTVGHGTTFTLYFPRSEAQSSASVPPLTSRPPRGNESIALVEDQALVRATTKRQLESLGYRVIDFETAAEALPTLRSEPHLSLLITDVVLAGGSGRELAEQLSKARPQLAVLFISGYTEDVVLRHGIELGDVNFLTKPFDVSELGIAVRRALDGKARARARDRVSP